MTDDVMKRLASIEPLPRGERLARYLEYPCDHPSFDALWDRLFDESRVINALDTLFSLDDVYPPRLVSLQEHADRWRDYAAPLRKTREERRVLRALLAKHGTHTIECAVFDRMLEDCTCRPGRWSPERQHAADCAKSRRPPCDCGWVEVER